MYKEDIHLKNGTLFATGYKWLCDNCIKNLIK